jgi:phage-related protein
MGIFSKVGHFFGNIGHTVGSAFSSGYKEVKNVVSGVGSTIKTQLSEAHKTVNNVIQDVSGLANKIVDKGEALVQHTEDKFSSIISTPLLLIAAGIGGLILFRGDSIANTAIKTAPYV